MNLEKYMSNQGKFVMGGIIDNKVDMLFEITETMTGVTRDQILSNRRNQEIAMARSIIGYMLHNELGVTVMNSGKIINRDHSTITHYSKSFEANYNFYSKYREQYENISELFWSNFIDVDSKDIDLEIKKLQNLIDKLEDKKTNLLTKNN